LQKNELFIPVFDKTRFWVVPGGFREGFGRVPGGFRGQNEVRNGSKFGSKKVIQTRSKKWSQTGSKFEVREGVPGGLQNGGLKNRVPATFLAVSNSFSHQNDKTCTWRLFGRPSKQGVRERVPGGLQNRVPGRPPKQGVREGVPGGLQNRGLKNRVPATFLAVSNSFSHQNAKTCVWRLFRRPLEGVQHEIVLRGGPGGFPEASKTGCPEMRSGRISRRVPERMVKKGCQKTSDFK